MSDIRTQEVEDLLTVFSGMSNNNEVFALLEDLFTVREIKDISQRLAVAKLLQMGKSYTFIEQSTGASATTIARVSKALNYGADGYVRALEILNHKTKASS